MPRDRILIRQEAAQAAEGSARRGRRLESSAEPKTSPSSGFGKGSRGRVRRRAGVSAPWKGEGIAVADRRTQTPLGFRHSLERRSAAAARRNSWEQISAAGDAASVDLNAFAARRSSVGRRRRFLGNIVSSTASALNEMIRDRTPPPCMAACARRPVPPQAPSEIVCVDRSCFKRLRREESPFERRNQLDENARNPLSDARFIASESAGGKAAAVQKRRGVIEGGVNSSTWRRRACRLRWRRLPRGNCERRWSRSTSGTGSCRRNEDARICRIARRRRR